MPPFVKSIFAYFQRGVIGGLKQSDRHDIVMEQFQSCFLLAKEFLSLLAIKTCSILVEKLSQSRSTIILSQNKVFMFAFVLQWQHVSVKCLIAAVICVTWCAFIFIRC